MAGLKIGTIEADIGLDTTGLVQGEKQVTNSTKRVNDQLKGVEVNSKKVSKGFKMAGRSAGQAGIQIQQFVGQLQGGQNAFVALSQQSADLGFVLGAPLVGVIVSLAAVVAGVLFNAFTASAEAADRAATSAADLGQEYLKLTGQSAALAAVKLSAQMVEDAEAVVLLGSELSSLRRAKRELLEEGQEGGGSIFIDPEILKAMDRDIAEVDNKFQELIKIQAFRQAEIAKFVAAGRGDFEGETDAPGGTGSTGGSTFNQLIQEEIATLQLRGQLFNDSNATIEAEIMRFELAALNLFEVGSEDFLAAEQALADKRVELRKAADDKIHQQTETANKRQAAQLRSAQTAALSGMLQLGDQMNQALEASGKEGSAIAKAIFLAQKAIQVVSILAATEVAAANAAAVSALGGPVAFFATQGAIRATGFASAGIVAGLGVAEAFADGGIVGGGSFTGDNVMARVNSGEMILNAGQQAKLFNMANSGASNGGGSPNITIISNGTPQTVTGSQISKGEVAIMINDAANATENKINGSLATGRGVTFQSLQKGAKIERNLR